MFTSSTGYATPRRLNQSFANAYTAIGVHTGVDSATPHRLVAMLYEGLLDSLAQARGALQSGNLELKGRELTRAIRILDEGLKGALSPAGGELSAQLGNLYAYLTLRLTEANLRNDETAIDECRSLIEPVHEAWKAIAPQIAVAAASDQR